jgi:hypothetical protein
MLVLKSWQVGAWYSTVVKLWYEDHSTIFKNIKECFLSKDQIFCVVYAASLGK